MENPAGSALWSWAPLRRALRRVRAGTVLLDQCQYGTPYKKPTRFDTNAASLGVLAVSCTCSRHKEPPRSRQGSFYLEVEVEDGARGSLSSKAVSQLCSCDRISGAPRRMAESGRPQGPREVGPGTGGRSRSSRSRSASGTQPPGPLRSPLAAMGAGRQLLTGPSRASDYLRLHAEWGAVVSRIKGADPRGAVQRRRGLASCAVAQCGREPASSTPRLPQASSVSAGSDGSPQRLRRRPTQR